MMKSATLALAAACAVTTFAAPAIAQDSTPMIAREVLFSNPERAQARISPDGKYLSFLAPVDGVLNVWVAPLNDPSAARAITSDTGRGVRNHTWSFNNGHIFYLQDTDGDENWRVYSTDVETGETIDLTPFDGVAAQIASVSPEHPDEILIGLNDRVSYFHDLYRINVRTGERTLVQEHPGMIEGAFVANFVTDSDYDVHFAYTINPAGGAGILRKTDAGWESYAEIDPEDMMTTAPAGIDRSGKLLYMVDSRGRNTSALTATDMSTGDSIVVAENYKADVSNAMADPNTDRVQAVAFNYDRVEWVVLDDAIRPDMEKLRSVADGDFSVSARSLDDTQWIVVYQMDQGPVRYYHYDRTKKKANFLFTNRPALEDLPLARMHPEIIRSRDGKSLVSYLTLPVGADPDGDGRPDEALPMVLFVHGGPWARDSWGYNPYHQWLANRGYAVLSVNFRGSTGFGKKFINAADGEWSGKMHDDLIDAVDWAVDREIADAERVGIMGGSYGGYATLAGLTFTPEFFACGVDIVGPSSLVTLMENIPDYWRPFSPVLNRRVGDVNTEEGRKELLARSPLTHADKIVKPLLIGQGANDPRVTKIESDQIVETMRKNKIPVTYVVFPDEGHGWARPENNLAFNAVTEAFLAEHLGGRYEPVDQAFDGSSIQVEEGAELVPGVAGALPGS